MIFSKKKISKFEETGIIYQLMCLPDKFRKKNQATFRLRYSDKSYSLAGESVMNFLLGYTNEIIGHSGKEYYAKIKQKINNQRNSL